MRLTQCRDQRGLQAFTSHSRLYHIVDGEILEVDSTGVKIEYADGRFKGSINGVPVDELYTTRQEAAALLPYEQHTMIQLVNDGLTDYGAKSLETVHPWRFIETPTRDDFHVCGDGIMTVMSQLKGWAVEGREELLKRVLKEMAVITLMANLNRHLHTMDIPFDALKKMKESYTAQIEQFDELA